MTIDLLRICKRRIHINSLFLSALMTVYVAFSFFLLVQWIAPSLDGRTDRHIAADSGTYIGAADALREGREDVFLTVALTSFPNTVLCPILLAFVLKSPLAMALADYAMFFGALVLLKRSFSFSTGVFVGLLLLNATTTISLLSVNKEIVDLLAVSLFFFARQRHRNGVLLLALLLALFNRFEVCIVMLTFLLAESELNPWRRRRFVTIIVLIAAMSVMLPLFASSSMDVHFAGVSDAHTIAWLDTLEMHYLFAVAVIPKIGNTLFGALVVHPFEMETYYKFADIANSSIIYSHCLADAVLFVILACKRRLTLSSDLVFFSMLGLIIMAVSMATVQRYTYFAYAVLCLEATRTGVGDREDISDHKRGHSRNQHSLADERQAACG